MAGLVTGSLALLWRIFEWWTERRPRVRAIASAAQLQPAAAGKWMQLRGEKFSPTVLLVEVINVSRRAITIESVGFKDSASEERSAIVPSGGELPANLEPGQKVTISSEIEQWKDKLGSVQLLPFCTDSEGHTHIGGPDEHFLRLVRGMTDGESGA